MKVLAVVLAVFAAAISVQANDNTALCTSCKIAVEPFKALIVQLEERAISFTKGSVCKAFANAPGDLQARCDEFAEKNIPEVFKAVTSKSPEEVCNTLRLCKPDEEDGRLLTSLSMGLKKVSIRMNKLQQKALRRFKRQTPPIQCGICRHVLEFAINYLVGPTVEDAVKSRVSNICGTIFGDETGDGVCGDIVGDLLGKAFTGTRKIMEPSTSCVFVTLCSDDDFAEEPEEPADPRRKPAH